MSDWKQTVANLVRVTQTGRNVPLAFPEQPFTSPAYQCTARASTLDMANGFVDVSSPIPGSPANSVLSSLANSGASLSNSVSRHYAAKQNSLDCAPRRINHLLTFSVTSQVPPEQK
jgi:hypothetical protein